MDLPWGARSLTDTLDPILVAAGFQTGQTGLPPGSTDEPDAVLYCMGIPEFVARWPRLAAVPPPVEGDHGCVDLTVHMDAANRLSHVDVEWHTMPELLVGVGLAGAAAELTAQEGRPIREATPVLARCLRVLFG